MCTKHYKIGYTQGVYDMFHIGHLNLLNHAKEHCDYLIVGVNADELVKSYKHKTPVINQEERQAIVANIKSVDECMISPSKEKKVTKSIDNRTNVCYTGYDRIFVPSWSIAYVQRVQG